MQRREEDQAKQDIAVLLRLQTGYLSPKKRAVRDFKLNHSVVTVGKTATTLHFAHKIHSVDKQQIKEGISPSRLP
ncbi:hypothetical protein BTVI_71710 [Pitangus sulphuratus]|nr:hypothetical protein BTVI_71710 [Pitangus sulphuratus]